MVRDEDWLLAINEVAFRAHREGRYELAASSFDLLLQLAFQIAAHSDDGQCLRSLALYLSYFASSLVGMHQFEEALLYFQMAQAWYLNGMPPKPNERQSAELVQLFGNTAVAFGRIGRLEQSIEIYTKCAEELEKNNGDPLLLAHVLTNRSNDYGVIGKLDEALADANLAIQLVETIRKLTSIRADDTLARAFQNKAVALSYQNRYVESMEYSRQARVHWEGRVKTTPDLFPEFARTLLNEAMCLRGLGHDLDIAARMCRQSISILETECVERGAPNFISELAMAHNTLGTTLVVWRLRTGIDCK